MSSDFRSGGWEGRDKGDLGDSIGIELFIGGVGSKWEMKQAQKIWCRCRSREK
jgi:hypothetical protein